MDLKSSSYLVANFHGHREVFGPVLPIIPVDDVDEAIHCIQDGLVDYQRFHSEPNYLSRPSPLVIYLFSTSEELKQRCEPSN